MLGAFRPAARAQIAANSRVRLRSLPGAARSGRQQAGSMSGGEQQMVALARALMSAPTFL